MLRHWILYLLTLAGCVMFYLAYRQWFGWFALICVLCLPIVALLISLPAMLKLKLTAKYPTELTVGEEQKVHFLAECPLPVSPIRYRLRVSSVLSGQEWVLKEGSSFPTNHCGKLICKLEKGKVYDYLGLFWLRIHKKTVKTITVHPIPVPMETVPNLERLVSPSWRPKPGGGFAENHEMRQYVPGDKMNQVHWKLTAKTGQIIVREPMEPVSSRVLIEMELRGTPEQLDRQFGQMIWLSEYLLQLEMKHELRVLTGSGVCCCKVTDQESLRAAITLLLGQKTAAESSVLEPVSAAWCCRIGGGDYEA